MDLERITQTNHPLYTKAINLYKISFPFYEQREALSQSQILCQSDYHFDVVCDDREFVGEVLYWEIGDFLYIEHLCVLPSMRNKRYGQKILEVLQTRPLILEIDPPVDELSIRRQGFYERCGFVENPYHHIHPPYHKENSGHELIVMSSPKKLTRIEYEFFRHCLQDTIMKQVYR